MSDSESDSKDSNGSQMECDVFALFDSFFLRLYSVPRLQHFFWMVQCSHRAWNLSKLVVLGFRLPAWICVEVKAWRRDTLRCLSHALLWGVPPKVRASGVALPAIPSNKGMQGTQQWRNGSYTKYMSACQGSWQWKMKFHEKPATWKHWTAQANALRHGVIMAIYGIWLSYLRYHRTQFVHVFAFLSRWPCLFFLHGCGWKDALEGLHHAAERCKEALDAGDFQAACRKG